MLTGFLHNKKVTKMVICIDGYNKGYSEGFNTGYNEEIAIAGAACVGAAVGAAAAIYYTQCRRQNTQIANARTDRVISNNLSLAE